jgi:hypothetical protein
LAAKNFRYSGFILAVVLFCCNATNAWSASALSVVKIEGLVNRKSAQSETFAKLNEGDILNDGDHIAVQPQSRLLLGDSDSKFWLGSNTSIIVKNGELLKNSGDPKKIVSLIGGNLRVKISSGKGENYEIKSKTAIAGVRGTEFFFANDDDNVTFCVLEGKAWIADQKTGNTFDVNEGAGVVLYANGQTKRTFTPEQVKADWIAMTAFSGERQVTGAIYRNDPPEISFADRWAYKYSIVAVARNYINRDYDFGKKDKQDIMYHTFFTPTLMFKSPITIQLTPRLFAHKSDRYLQWDDVPDKRERFRKGFSMQEAFAEVGNDSLGLRYGIFSLDWNEGALFMTRQWMHEPVTHYGALAHYVFPFEATNVKVEMAYTMPSEVKDRMPADGRTQIGIHAIRFTEAKDRLTLTLLDRETGKFNNAKNYYYKTGNKIRQGIIAAKDTYEYFDYNASYGYQKVKAFIDAKGFKAREYIAKSYDAALGVPLPQGWRIQARYIYADPDYVPGSEDYYEMGFIGRWFHTNIKQRRFLVEKAIGDNDRIRLEATSGRAAGNSIYGTYQSAKLPPVKDRTLADEYDLIWSSSWTKSVQTFASAWYFKTGQFFAVQDPAWGANLGVRVTH